MGIELSLTILHKRQYAELWRTQKTVVQSCPLNLVLEETPETFLSFDLVD